jgi:hypothetical protein
VAIGVFVVLVAKQVALSKTLYDPCDAHGALCVAGRRTVGDA